MSRKEESKESTVNLDELFHVVASNCTDYRTLYSVALACKTTRQSVRDGVSLAIIKSTRTNINTNTRTNTRTNDKRGLSHAIVAAAKTGRVEVFSAVYETIGLGGQLYIGDALTAAARVTGGHEIIAWSAEHKSGALQVSMVDVMVAAVLSKIPANIQVSLILLLDTASYKQNFMEQSLHVLSMYAAADAMRFLDAIMDRGVSVDFLLGRAVVGMKMHVIDTMVSYERYKAQTGTRLFVELIRGQLAYTIRMLKSSTYYIASMQELHDVLARLC